MSLFAIYEQDSYKSQKFYGRPRQWWMFIAEQKLPKILFSEKVCLKYIFGVCERGCADGHQILQLFDRMTALSFRVE